MHKYLMPRELSSIAVTAAILIMAACGSQETTTPADLSDWTSFNPVTALSADTFANPPMTDWPWVRWNVPETAEIPQLEQELEAMREAGIAGAEIGQGGFPNNEQLAAILRKATELGIKISISHGPTQNPEGYSADDDNARKTLYFGRTVVDAGSSFEGPLPEPTLTVVGQGGFGGRGAGGPGGGRGGRGGGAAGGRGGAGRGSGQQEARSTLIAVMAYRCLQTPCPETGPAELDRSSYVELTSAVNGGNSDGVLGGTTAGSVQWTAPASPAGAQWQLIAFWTRGVSAQPDPFSEEGLEDLINSMETGLSSEVKELMAANGGDLFYDSHSSDRGSPDELWTNKMAEEFSQRRQYPLIPNLPALFREFYDFDDGTAPRVRNDFYAVRGDIWIEKQLEPLREWVRQYNSVLRVQVEGEANLIIPITDMVQATAAVDRPEHENLFVGDEIDNYLPMASANHMTGNPWYSTECCAALNRSYAQTFQDTVIRMHRSFIGGITKLVYHVYPYSDSPTSPWPGYHNFGQAGFSNAWGPREPYWTDALSYNTYFARTQQALTQGDAKTDVAVYMQNYLYPPSQGYKFRHWGDLTLQEAGYTRDYLNPTMLELPEATVTGGRLAADGPAYKALIIDSEQGPPTDPVKTSMPISVAQKILGYARVGLPVIVVGTPPDRTPGNPPEQDAELGTLIGQLLGEETVHQVAHEADVPAMLRSLGIRPAADPETPSPVLSIRRRDQATNTDYYFFYNQGIVSPPDEPMTLFEPATGEPVEREVSLEGRGQPYLLDAWSGKITQITNYASDTDRIRIRVQLAPDDATLIAISDEPNRFGTTDTAEEPAPSGLTAPIELTNATWHLAVEDWQPANPYDTTLGAAATETRKVPVEVDLQGLRAWPEIPELQHASGIGTYTTTLNLPDDWSSQPGAILSLGEVFDSFTLMVNGTSVPIDQISAEADVGPYLRAGANTIAMRVATTLNNRLAALDDSVAQRGMVQPYGLVGPVVLRPYAQASVRD